MLVVAKRRFTRKYVIGGAGFFDSVAGVFNKIFASDVAKRVASSALSAGKDAARELGKKALDVGKNTAVEVGKRLIDKTAAKHLASSTHPVVETTPTLTRENAAVLARLIDNDAEARNSAGTNINNILAGYGLDSKPVSIRDLVRRLNAPDGAGLKLA